MILEYKVNTGTVKIGKELSIFREKDFKNLAELEKSPKELFINFFRKNIKNSFSENLSMRQICDINMFFKNGFKSVTFTKRQRGCFITYTFDIN